MWDVRSQVKEVGLVMYGMGGGRSQESGKRGRTS